MSTDNERVNEMLAANQSAGKNAGDDPEVQTSDPLLDPEAMGRLGFQQSAYRHGPPEGMSLADEFGRFLLKPETPPEKTEGGIWVEQAAAPVGVVVEGRYRTMDENGEEVSYAEGRRVLYKQYHGTTATINGEEYVIVEGQHLLLWLGDDDEVEAG